MLDGHVRTHRDDIVPQLGQQMRGVGVGSVDYVPGKKRSFARVHAERGLRVGRDRGHRSVGLDGEARGIFSCEVVPEGRDEAVGVEGRGFVGDCAVAAGANTEVLVRLASASV